MLATAARLCLGTLVAVGGLLLTPATAHACSCVGGDAGDFARWADVVVVGTVRDRDSDDAWWRPVGGGPDGGVTYDLAVDRVLKGTAGTRVLVESAVGSAACGVDLSVGRTYLLHAERARDGGLSANACGGTHEVTPTAVQSAEERLGPAHEPEASDPSDDGSGASAWWSVSGVALTGSVLAATALGVLRRRRVTP
jgi:hypothetical protein